MANRSGVLHDVTKPVLQFGPQPVYFGFGVCHQIEERLCGDPVSPVGAQGPASRHSGGSKPIIERRNFILKGRSHSHLVRYSANSDWRSERPPAGGYGLSPYEFGCRVRDTGIEAALHGKSAKAALSS
jgi:hypothetical protein